MTPQVRPNLVYSLFIMKNQFVFIAFYCYLKMVIICSNFELFHAPPYFFFLHSPLMKELFINYKLKSVAHLNWRTLSYKSINTFIDDLFAFVIKMPIMHRMACLRDDLIFFIYCYQRYIYKTDYTRVNEYGQCTQPTKDMLKEQEQLKLTATTTTTTTTSSLVSRKWL